MANKSKFETVGDSAGRLGRVAQPVKGKSIKKTGNAKGGAVEPFTAGVKRNIQESLGFKGAPVPILNPQNAPEASLTQRNTLYVRTSVGNRDFWNKRQFGQNS